MKIELTRLELFNELKNDFKHEPLVFFEKSIQVLKKKCHDESLLIDNLEIIKEKIRIFQVRVRQKYEFHNRIIKKFLESENKWLESQVFNEDFSQTLDKTEKRPNAGTLNYFFLFLCPYLF